MIINECRKNLFSGQLVYGGSGSSSGGSSKNTTTINKTPTQTVNRAGKGDLNSGFSWSDHLIPSNVNVNASNNGVGGSASWNCGSCHGGSRK